MSRSERRKGIEAERGLVRYFRDVKGYKARRVPLSGAMHEKGDLVVRVDRTTGDDPRDDSTTYRIEVKVRHDGFKQLYRWLEGHDALCIRADRKDWLVVMKLEEWDL